MDKLNTQPQPKAWAKPQVVRIGKIGDVAGSSNLNGQSSGPHNTKS